MAGASLLVLLDDIASVLDDVALLTKVAAKKTAGVLGDDLALNAHQLSDLRADRELPVVWAVAKGSLRNKAILVPAALAISALIPWAVLPLLMVGGAYLCYEGVEKVLHWLLHRGGERSDAKALAGDDEDETSFLHTAPDPLPTPVLAMAPEDLEKQRIRGAIRTDFILSAEIVTIALGTVAHVPFLSRVLVLCGIAVLMTVGVYGFVAGVVKLDDLGVILGARSGRGAWDRLVRAAGRVILGAAPWILKTLSVVGTVAMFLVGGGLLTHGVPVLYHAIESRAADAALIPGVGAVVGAMIPMLVNVLVGAVIGSLVLGAVALIRRLRARRTR